MKTYAQIIQQHQALHGTHEAQVEELVEEQPVKYITLASMKYVHNFDVLYTPQKFPIKIHADNTCHAGLSDYLNKQDGQVYENSGLIVCPDLDSKGLAYKECMVCHQGEAYAPL